MPAFESQHRPRAFSQSIWQDASRRLLAKVIEELAYERVFDVVEDRPGHFSLAVGGAIYRFRGRRYVFDNVVIEPGSIVRVAAHGEAPVIDPLAFVAEVLPILGVKPMTAAHFLRELGNTLVADAHGLASATKTGGELAELSDIDMEGETNGHPWITVSKGRIGFGYGDYAAYAPESRKPLKILWIGVSKRRAQFVAQEGLSNAALVQEAVGPQRFQAFVDRLKADGFTLDTHLMMPVHPWQWDNAIVLNFAADIAAGEIVLLGEGEDLYLPQQSVRTVSNRSHPAKSTLKLCLNILNTAVYRGIPGKRALAAAALTGWLDQVAARDPVLNEDCGLVLLGERAGMHYSHAYYSSITAAPYQFNEMLGCLWRDSLPSHLRDGESGMPLAGMMHAGCDGKPVALALAEKAGVSLSVWLRRFFDVLVVPVYHLLVRHGLYFSAHGQNATIILRNGMPQRLALRDFIDDVMVCDQDFPETADLPEGPKAVLLRLPPEVLIHGIQTTLFICVFRYMSVLLDRQAGLSEAEFWSIARESILDYQRRHPELIERFRQFDLFADAYPRLCLNRVRLFTHGYGDDDERPVPDFQGMVSNPLVHFTRQKTAA